MHEKILTCRRLRYSIDEDTEKRNPQEYIESNGKSEQQPFSIMEPMRLLLLSKSDTREIWFELSITTLLAISPTASSNNVPIHASNFLM